MRRDLEKQFVHPFFVYQGKQKMTNLLTKLLLHTIECTDMFERHLKMGLMPYRNFCVNLRDDQLKHSGCVRQNFKPENTHELTSKGKVSLYD